MKHLIFNSKMRCVWLLVLAPSLAQAHSIHMTIADWQTGFFHPLQGLDHVCAMLAVGLWAAQLRGQLWLLPLTFVTVMVLGGLTGARGLTLDHAETIILLSGLVLSVLAVKKINFNSRINMLIVAFFAFFHGYAHGAEISTSAEFLPYSLGFITATSLLHLTGVVIAKLMQIAMRQFSETQANRCA